MNIIFADLKKIFIFILVLLIIFLSIFFFAFLALIILPSLIMFFIIKKLLISKNKYNVNSAEGYSHKENNQNFIDVDFKKKDEKDI